MSFQNNLLSNTFGNNAGSQTQKTIEQQKQLALQERNVQQPILSEGTPFYVNRLEHAAGMAHILDFVSHYIKKGSPLNVKDDILYFDNLLSSKVLMGRIRPTHLEQGESDTILKYNPFLCSYFDFIAHTKWEKAFVWRDKIYLLSQKVDLNSFNVKSIPSFTLAIQVDDISKFEKWRGETSLDIRKVIFKSRTEDRLVNEHGELMDISELEDVNIDLIPDDVIAKWANVEEQSVVIPIQAIEDSVVEQTIPLQFLDESNHHLIYSANKRKLDYEAQKLVEQTSMSAENKMKTRYSENMHLYQFFTIETNNKEQRDYAVQEKEWASQNGLNESEMGWNKFRAKIDEDDNAGNGGSSW